MIASTKTKFSAYIIGLILLSAFSAQAKPIAELSVPADQPDLASFGDQLSVIWNNHRLISPDALRVKTIHSTYAQKRSLERQLTQFAIVASGELYSMADNNSILVVAALWPRYIYGLSSVSNSINLPLRNPTYVSTVADYIYTSLLEWSASEQRSLILPLTGVNLPANYIIEDSFPSQQSTSIMSQNPNMRIVPINNALLERLGLAHPWLIPAPLPVLDSIRSLSNYWLVVTTADTKPELIAKFLSTLYGLKTLAHIKNKLFLQLDADDNKFLSALFAYTPQSIKFFGLRTD